jgi:hypothetical protein
MRGGEAGGQPCAEKQPKKLLLVQSSTSVALAGGKVAYTRAATDFGQGIHGGDPCLPTAAQEEILNVVVNGSSSFT